MASDKEKDRSLDGRDTGQRSRGPSDTNSVGSRSDKDVDRSLGGGGGLNRGGMMGNRERQGNSMGRDSGYSGRGGMNSPGEGARSSGSSVGGREVGDVGGMARDVGQVGNGLRGGMAMERATDLASARRASENASMDTLGRMRSTDMAALRRADENQSMDVLNATRMALLDTIAGTESPNYSTGYGGWTTDDLSQHPQRSVTITSGPNKGRKTSAFGRYQFLGSTWNKQQQKLGLPDMSPKSQDQAAWDLAVTAYKNATGKSLDAALADPTPETMAQVSRALSGTWTSLPGGIEQTTSTGRFARNFERHLSSRKSGQQTGAPLSVDRPTQVAAEVPIPSSFETKYLGAGAGQTGVYEAAKEQGLDVNSPAVTASADVAQKEYVAANYAAYNNPQTQISRQAPSEVETAPTVQTASVAPAVDTATSVQPTQPATVQPATARETLKPETATYQQEEDETPKQRTTGQQVAATGADIGMGLIPGIGIGLSLVNGALTLTGNRTLGERLIDAVGTGDGTGFNPAERDPSRRENRERKEKATTTVIAANPKRFEEKYLAFVDTTKRPTPAEKWGTGTSNYGDREYG